MGNLIEHEGKKYRVATGDNSSLIKRLLENTFAGKIKEVKDARREKAKSILLDKFPLLPNKSNPEGMSRIIDAMIEFSDFELVKETNQKE